MGDDNHDSSDLLPQLQAERDSLDPSFMHSSKLLDQEIERVKSGRPAEAKKYLEVHSTNPTKVAIKVLLPTKEHPKVNFVGKLLGPGGQTLKKLQQDTICRMAIMGRGSMKDKRKEEELRKEGDPKNAHLNDPLHLNIEAMAPAVAAYARIADALKEIEPFLQPDRDDSRIMASRPDLQMSPYENGSRGHPQRGPAPVPGDRSAYRDSYYDAPPAAAAPPRGYDDYRPAPRDVYDRPREYERAHLPAATRGIPRDSYYDYGHNSSGAPPVARDRYDEYETRGGSWGGQPTAGGYKTAAPPYKGAGGTSRGRGADRPHPYSAGSGRGIPRY